MFVFIVEIMFYKILIFFMFLDFFFDVFILKINFKNKTILFSYIFFKMFLKTIIYL